MRREAALASEVPAPGGLESSGAAQPGLPALDLLRFVSVSAIIWFHAGGAHADLFTFRLPAIALITSFVQSRSSRWRPSGVLIPWAFWYAVYLAVLAYRVMGHGLGIIHPEIVWYNPFIGPAFHLWYGPFALAAGYAAHRWRTTPRLLLFATAAAGFGVAYALRGAAFPTHQWARILPAIAIGMLLAREDTKLRHVAAMVVMGVPALGVQYVVAILLVWAASRWRGPRLKTLATFSRGAYWVHIMAIDLVYKFGLDDGVWALLATFVAAGLLTANSWSRRLI